jgi:lon-related putative ATP-dependent protease
MPELTAAQLCRRFDPQALNFDTTAGLKPLENIIGQKRAISALRFGLGIQETGFNIFVSGPAGIGKMTAVQSFVEAVARSRSTPADWCYLNNFDDPNQPRTLSLPAGRGHQFKQDMKDLIEHVRRSLLRAFESEGYTSKRDEVMQEASREQESMFAQLAQRANKAGIALQVTPMGMAMIPMLGDRPLKENEFQALPPDKRAEFIHRREELEVELQAVMKKGRELEKSTQAKLQALDEQVANYVVGQLFDELKEPYHDAPAVLAYLAAVQQDILANIDRFKSEQPQPKPVNGDGIPIPAPWLRDLPFRKYAVNLLVDHAQQTGAPVVVLLNPVYNNLFGHIERENQFGALYTDFTMIRPGALQRANGGYLVARMEDLLKNPLSWDGLKRALRGHEAQLEEPGDLLGFMMTKTIKPQPIPLDVKVILVGPPHLFSLLQVYDDEFTELFRVRADFDTSMPASDENIQDCIGFMATLCHKENLKHLDGPGAALLLEHAARLAEDQQKLSTHFGALAQVMREASYWAAQDNASSIGAPHVRKALSEKIYRSNLIQERIQEMIARNLLLIDVEGQSVGQVNGLSVLALGDFQFGRPSRITASIAPGREGIVDIEREVELGGPIHSKGVLILNGYLNQQFAQEHALSLSAHLVFEQSYEGVEGDSASSAELYALLSALAGVPVRQGLAVTGSVNQRGIVQAIGGVNEKVEGFFDVCKAKGLTGEQGVLIPQSNLQNLMLRDDVVEAVQRGQFHVWGVSTIDEGIELLTGMPAGVRDAEGRLPVDSIYGKVAFRLEAYHERLNPPDEKDLPFSAPVLHH